MLAFNIQGQITLQIRLAVDGDMDLHCLSKDRDAVGSTLFNQALYGILAFASANRNLRHRVVLAPKTDEQVRSGFSIGFEHEAEIAWPV